MADTALQKLDQEIKQLDSEIAQLTRQREARERARQVLAAMEEHPSNITASTNDYEGMPLVKAVSKYLNGRGKPAKFDEILDALRRGGADLGNENRQDRNLKIAIRMNSKKKDHPLSYDEPTGIVGLRNWPKHTATRSA